MLPDEPETGHKKPQNQEIEKKINEQHERDRAREERQRAIEEQQRRNRQKKD
jgi:hypothetical protein